MAQIGTTVFFQPDSPNGAQDGWQWRNSTTGELRYYAGGAWQPADATETAPVVIIGPTSPQLKVGYDTSNYMTVAVSAAGAVTLDAVGASAGFTFSDAVTINGALDMGANIISNIGNAGTDFLSNGGLTLANALTVTTGGLTVTAGGLTITAGSLRVDASVISIGGAPGALGRALDIVPGLLLSGSATQNALILQPTFGSDATTLGTLIYANLRLTNAAFTMVTGTGIHVDSPTLPHASNVITTNRGIYVSNQGSSKITNAYGIYIEAPTNAVTTNVGLYNAGTSSLVGTVGQGFAGAPAGSGINVGAASTNNAIHTASQGASTTTLYIGNAAITVVSDVRVKKDITPTQIDALGLLRRMKVVDFAWNDPSDTAPNNRNSRGRWTGMLAQDLVDVVPWIVNAEDRTCPVCRAGEQCALHTTPWHVDLEHMAGVFVAGIQSLDHRVAVLERQLVRA